MTGDGKGEAGTASSGAGNKYGSAVKFRQFTDNGKSQSGTGDTFALRPSIGNVGIEDGREEGGGDTVSVVADADIDVIVVRVKVDGDVAASGRMLQRINQEVPQESFQLIPVKVQEAGIGNPIIKGKFDVSLLSKQRQVAKGTH